MTIRPPAPEMDIILHLTDIMNGDLTVQIRPWSPGVNFLGIAVSDADEDTAAFLLDPDDRRALAAALLEGLDADA